MTPVMACVPAAEWIVALVSASLVLGWMLSALFGWWWESRDQRPVRWSDHIQDDESFREEQPQ